MAEISAEQIAQRVIDCNLIEDRQLDEAWSHFGRRNVPGDDFLQYLLRKDILTNYQSEKILKGDRSGYFYGDYKVLYKVGAGSFARVYRAVNKLTGDVVAVKVLRKRFANDPDQTAQFLREGQMGEKLLHPNVVHIFEVYSKLQTHYIVMEFIEGRSLREFIRVRKKLDPLEATRLMIDIAGGLSYAHENGVTHRDLKLSNILISSRGVAKLVDFGLAAGGGSGFNLSVLAQINPRTLDYAGLEQVSNSMRDDPRSDIYFLGTIFYHILSGTPPLVETKNKTERMSAARFLQTVPLHSANPELPRLVTAIVNKAMALELNKRYQSPREMLVDLRVAAARLAEGNVEKGEEEQHDNLDDNADFDTLALKQHYVMIVEGNTELQDYFRNKLKKGRQRILITNNPEMPARQFHDKSDAAGCVLFSTGAFGKDCIEAYNRFTQNEDTQKVPAILLLSEEHQAFRSLAAPEDEKHRIISMPLKLKELRGIISEFVQAKETPSK